MRRGAIWLLIFVGCNRVNPDFNDSGSDTGTGEGSTTGNGDGNGTGDGGGDGTGDDDGSGSESSDGSGTGVGTGDTSGGGSGTGTESGTGTSSETGSGTGTESGTDTGGDAVCDGVLYAADESGALIAVDLSNADAPHVVDLATGTYALARQPQTGFLFYFSASDSTTLYVYDPNTGAQANPGATNLPGGDIIGRAGFGADGYLYVTTDSNEGLWRFDMWAPTFPQSAEQIASYGNQIDQGGDLEVLSEMDLLLIASFSGQLTQIDLATDPPSIDTQDYVTGLAPGVQIMGIARNDVGLWLIDDASNLYELDLAAPPQATLQVSSTADRMNDLAPAGLEACP